MPLEPIAARWAAPAQLFVIHGTWEYTMRMRRHLYLLLIVSLAWFLFWIAGLPDYYRQYSAISMLAFDIIILPPIWILVYSRIKKTRSGRGLAVSVWLAFYVTVPLFLYDLLYCGYYLGRGINFVWEYWYLTVYYIVPWLIFPVTGWWVDQRRREVAVSEW
jgi:hypothetical protein